MPTTDWPVLRQIWGRGEHFGLKAQSSLPRFVCAYHPPLASTSIRWGGGDKKRSKVKKEESGKLKKRCQSFYMHTFQLMLKTYLYVAH